jgi:hypothetical protein
MDSMADDGNEGNDYVVVRADVVQGDFDLVIPVDAASSGVLTDTVLVKLDDLLDLPATPTVLPVVGTFPNPPHVASTFITPGEFELYPAPEYCPPGRHPQSPGSNPWG